MIALQTSFFETQMARVDGLFLAASNRDAMREVQTLQFVKDKGVREFPEGEWDRYSIEKGSYSHKKEKGRQVTLVSREGCDLASIKPVECRRNVCITGISASELNEAVGREVRIGPEVRLFAHRKTVPCKPLGKRTGQGIELVDRFWDHAGVSCEILQTGVVRKDDRVDFDVTVPADTHRIDAPGWTHELLNVPPSQR